MKVVVANEIPSGDEAEENLFSDFSFSLPQPPQLLPLYEIKSF